MSLSRGRWRAIVAAGSVLVAGCARVPTAPRLQTAVLTADRPDAYRYVARADRVTVDASAIHRPSNVRELFWDRRTPDRLNAETCATWSGQQGSAQQGAALRIVTRPGYVRAVTVTRNVWGYVAWTFNFHVWDSRGPDSRQIGSVTLGEQLDPSGTPAPLPWHLCARAVGPTVEFVVWRLGQRRPAWGQAGHGGKATVPDGWVQAGRAGWYIGHLEPGGTATFSGLSTAGTG